jgi:hypothetical protein
MRTAHRFADGGARHEHARANDVLGPSTGLANRVQDDLEAAPGLNGGVGIA